MKKIFLVIVVAALAIMFYVPDLLAQGDDWYVSATNYARYYHFKETKSDSAATRFQFDIYMGKFYTGAWYELKHNMGDFNTTNSLTQRYFGWEENGLSVHAGTFYKVFDRGLVLNTFQDDVTGVNKMLDGFLLNWRKKYIDIDALSATEGIGGGFGKHIIRGGRVKLKPINKFHLGGAYVSRSFDSRQSLKQANARINLDNIDGYIEYAKRYYTEFNIDDPENPLRKTGDGTYANITAYYSNITGFFEYKNYIFLLYPEAGYLNIPPAANKQDRLLQFEAVNIDGERGYRGNITVSWSDYWGFEADYAKAYSRDDSLSLALLEAYFEIRGNYYQDNTFHVGLDLFEFTRRDETKSEFEFSYNLGDFNSIEILGSMTTFEPIDSSSYTEKYLDITFSHAPSLRLTVGGSLSDNLNSDDLKRMAHIELTLLLDNHDLVVFYGSQRGGLVCSGGLCTYHTTFEGLRVSLLSRF